MPPAQCGLRASAVPQPSTNNASTVPTAACRRRFTSVLLAQGSQAESVHGQPETGAEVAGRLARRLHARHEDLEVLHDFRDLVVDGELQRDLLVGLVDVQEA